MFDYTDLTSAWVYKGPVLARHLTSHADNSDICYQRLKNEYAESITQSIVTVNGQVWKKYTASSIVFDSAGTLTTTEYTVPAGREGLYVVQGCMTLGKTVTPQTTLVSIAIYVNGVEFRRGDYCKDFDSSDNNNSVAAEVICMLNLSVGDLITMYVYADNGTAALAIGTLTGSGVTNNTVLNLFRIGANS